MTRRHEWRITVPPGDSDNPRTGTWAWLHCQRGSRATLCALLRASGWRVAASGEATHRYHGRAYLVRDEE